MSVKSALLSTRIQLEGQQEWSRQLELAKQSVKELKSELALLNSEYQNEKNSVEYLRKSTDLYTKMLAQYTKQLDNLEKEQASYVKQQKGYEQELEAAKEKHKALSDSLEGHIALTKNAITATEHQIAKIKEAQKAEEDRLTYIKPQLRQYQEAIDAANKAIDTNNKEVEKNSGKIETAIEREKKYQKVVEDYLGGTYKKRQDALATLKNDLDDYNILLKNGGITQEEYNKKVEELQPKLYSATLAMQKSQEVLDKKTEKVNEQKAKIDELSAANVALNDASNKQRDIIAENVNKLNEEYKERDRLNTELEDQSMILNNLTVVYDKETKEVKDAEDRIKALNIHLTDNEKNQQRVATEINKVRVQMNDANDVVRKNNEYIKEATDNERDYTKALDNRGKEIDQEKEKEKELAEAEKARQIALQQTQKAYEQLTKFITDCSNAAREYETRLANVQKTTNMTDTELAVFGEELQKLSERIPISANALADIAEKAGQLGIANKDLKEFTETMAMMGVSTDLSATDAAQNLAQVASITGLAADQYSRLSSSIVALGNNFATGERNIVEFTQRIAASASNAGMAESEMVAYATAISSLGIRADAGGTALQSLIGKIDNAVATGNKITEWARVCGMSTEELVELWENDAAKAIQIFIRGLGNLDESYTKVLKGLGVGEQRIIRTVASLANAEKETDLLTRALDMSNQAWEENNALQLEASKRYETTDSKIQIYKNSVENIKTTIGEQLNPALAKLAEMGTSLNKFIEWLVNNLPSLGGALVGIVASVGALNVSLSGTGKNLKNVVKSITSSIDPVSLAISAVAGLTAAVIAYNLSLETPLKETKKFTKAIEENRQEQIKSIESTMQTVGVMNGEIARLEQLVSIENKDAADKAMIAKLVAELNKTVPDLNLAYNKEADALVDVTTNTQLNVEQLKRLASAKAEAIVLEKKQEALTQMYVDRINLETELNEVESELLVVQKQLAEHTYTTREEAVELTRREKELTKQQGLLTNQITATDDAIDKYWVAIKGASDATDDAATHAVPNLKQALDDLHSELAKSSAEATSKFTISFTEALDNVDKKTQISAKKIRDNLMSQLNVYANAADNLKKLQDKNIDGLNDMLREMQKNGQLSADVIAALAGATDKELKEIVQNYNDVKEAATALGEEEGKLATDYYEKLKAIREELGLLREEASKKINVEINFKQTGNKAIDLGNSTPNTKAAQGLEYVPFDDYSALLHEGEMVLTKAEARAYRYEHSHGQSVTNNRNYGGVTLNVYAQQGQDVDSLADEIMYRIEDATKRKESTWA